MEKKIIATNIDGFLIKHEAFIEPHKAWFERAIQKTGDESLREWIGKKDYFKGVDIAMEKLMPDATLEERTVQARTWYQKDVIAYIREHPEVVFNNVAESLKRLKQRFTLALITVNSEDYINQILGAAGLTNIYDIIFAIKTSEKPDKAALFEKFVKEHGEPICYIAARSKEAFEECINLGTLCIYASWDEYDEDIANLVKEEAKTPVELEAKIINLS